MRSLFFCLITFCFIQTIQSQDFVDNWYSDESGLPQNSVKDIAEDKDGFIWFATESGLVRYNGQKFKIFSDIQGLDNHRMENFFKKNDTLFVRTSKNEILYIDRINPHYYSNKNSDTYRYFCEIDKNSFLLAKFKVKTNPDHIFHTIKDEKVNILLTDSQLILLNANDEVVKSYHINDFKDFKASFVKDNHWILVLKNSILKYDFKNLEFKNINPSIDFDISQVFYNEAHEQVTVVNGQKVYQIKTDTEDVNLIKVHDNLDAKDRFINCFYYDNSISTLYSGSWAFGFCVSKPNRFDIIQAEKNRSKNLTYAFNWNKKDSIFLPNGVVIKNGKIIQQNAINHDYLIKQFFPRDEKGFFYAANKRDIVKIKFNEEDLTYSEEIIFEFESDLGLLYTSKNNELYVSTRSFNTKLDTYLFKTKNLNEKKQSLDTVLKLNKQQILYLSESNEQNELWLGTDNGVYIFNKNNKQLEQLKGTENTTVRSITDKGDYLWIASYDDGFYLYNRKKATLNKFPYDKEQRLATVHHVIEDDYNQVWLPTNKGLFKADKTELFDFANNKHGQINYYYFDKKDGLSTNEFNGGCYPCRYKDKNGKIIIPSLNGLVSFYPKDFVEFKKNEGKVFLDEIILDGKSFYPTNKFSIPKDFKTLEIRIDALSFNKLPVINFTSPLAPNLSEYSSVTEGKLIFTSLPHGKHQLNFSLGSTKEDSQTTLILDVEKKWYETYAFRFGIILFTAGLVFLILRLVLTQEEKRRTQLRRIINEKTKQLQSTIQDLRTSQNHFKVQLENQKKIVASISHDIKSPLQYLGYGIDFLEDNLKDKKLDQDVYDNLNALSSSVDNLKEFTQNILDFSKAMIQNEASDVKKVEIRELVEEKASLFEQMCKTKKIQIEINSKPKVTFALNKNFFSVILHNILDNAIKNTYNGTIKIKIQKIGKHLLLKVSDSGSGMNNETLERYRKVFEEDNYKENVSGSGLGLFIVSETARLMNATIQIDSEKGVGTEFLMKLK